jgi:hypothetical protein
VVKNYFYSTIRKQLRKLVRSIKEDQRAEPEEVSIGYMRSLLREHNMSYNEIDNENIKDLLIYLDQNEKLPVEKEGSVCEVANTRYSLYFLVFYLGGDL